MRVTNNMINKNTKYNVNTNKYLVDKYNTSFAVLYRFVGQVNHLLGFAAALVPN